MWELGIEMKLCAQGENKPIWWTCGIFSCATYLLNPYTNPLNGFNILFFFPDEEIDSEKSNDLLKTPKSWEGGDLNSINLAAQSLKFYFFLERTSRCRRCAMLSHSVMSDSL